MPIFNTNVFRAGGRKENDRREKKKSETKLQMNLIHTLINHKNIRKNSCEKRKIQLWMRNTCWHLYKWIDKYVCFTLQIFQSTICMQNMFIC